MATSSQTESSRQSDRQPRLVTLRRPRRLACSPAHRVEVRPEHDVPQLPVEGTSCPVGKKGAWVTVRLCKAWNDRATECCVYINASRHHVASYLTHTLERYRFPGKHVEST
jgi:hypothetical protein